MYIPLILLTVVLQWKVTLHTFLMHFSWCTVHRVHSSFIIISTRYPPAPFNTFQRAGKSGRIRTGRIASDTHMQTNQAGHKPRSRSHFIYGSLGGISAAVHQCELMAAAQRRTHTMIYTLACSCYTLPFRTDARKLFIPRSRGLKLQLAAKALDRFKTN